MDISIVIPVYNDKERLKDCLESLFSQEYPQDRFEIIVVDDGSYDGTERVLETLSREHPDLRYFLRPHQGPAAARNFGWQQARAQIVGFTDNDCILQKDWIKKMVLAHKAQADLTAVGGLTKVRPVNIKALVSQFLSDGSIEVEINGTSEVIFFPTCNVSLKKELLSGQEFNPLFTLPAGEDLEFFWRLFKQGNRFAYIPDIEIFHNCHLNFRSFLKQAYRYGRGNFLAQFLHQDHPLLKELRLGNLSFWQATFVNFCKIPRFSYLLGNRLIGKYNVQGSGAKAGIYFYFALHKICYLAGNIVEFFRTRRKDFDRNKQPLSVPRLLILDITHSCNLSCRICDIWKTSGSEKDMIAGYVKKILTEASLLGIKEIALSGGEPLARKDIFEILEHARNAGIKHLGILTNGILLEEFLARLESYLIDSAVSPVISLDSLKPDVHNHARNSGLAWEKSVKSLKALALLKNKHRQVNFNVITMITNQNLKELADIASFIKSLGANSLQFQALLPNNLNMAERKKSVFWVSEENLPVLDQAIESLVLFKRENPGFIKNSEQNLLLIKKYFRGKLTPKDARCLSAGKTVLISNQGKCSTCFSSYGDIRIMKLEEILRSEDILTAQEKVRNCSWPCLLPCFCDL